MGKKGFTFMGRIVDGKIKLMARTPDGLSSIDIVTAR